MSQKAERDERSSGYGNEERNLEGKHEKDEEEEKKRQYVFVN